MTTFTQQPYRPGETIAAIATPLGEGGVAIIRISGKEAVDVADKVFSGSVRKYATHTVHYGHIRNAAGEHVDDALLIPMLKERSYTGEDTIEIHCHGGSLITRRVLEVVLAAGARHALPGEFTFKAFMNGKIDLAQAEAVQALIGAKNERALDAAEGQLQGALSQKILRLQRDFTEVAAILNAWVDFPEEGIEFITMEELCDQLSAHCDAMESLLKTFHDGKIVQEGIVLCLAGLPNVGKSSLMNALLEKDRAIVSHIPGTTRDILEDHLWLNGLNFRLIDTAGIRETDGVIEQEGIRRTHDAMSKSDLILLVLDASRPLEAEELLLLDQAVKTKTIIIWNKIDLPHAEIPEVSLEHIVEVSAREKVGLDLLKKKIDEVIWDRGPPSKEEVLITSARHKEALAASLEACRRVLDGLRTGVSPEFLSIDIRSCLSELGKIIGVDVTEDILTAIFSKFCIGK